MATVLVVVEAQPDGKLKKATLSAISAGKQLGDVHAVVLGEDPSALAAEVKDYVKVVHAGSAPHLVHYLAETYAPAIAELATSINAEWVGAAATQQGRDLMPRVAARLNAAMASDIMAVNGTTLTRPMWAGAVIAEVTLSTAVKCFSVRTTEFPAAEKGGAGEVKKFAVAGGPSTTTKFVEFKEVKSARPELTEAKIVVSGGRGTKGDFKEVEALADELGAAVGASRAVCDAGWMPNDLQVGQTGKVVAPQLYIAAGISGAIQHLAGMKGSKTIVAINKDGEAPIFQVADYGLVADLFKALPELRAAIKSSEVIAVDESFLQGIGVHRIPTPVPFMEAGGPANAYAIEDVGGGFTLFDCACGTDEGLAALRAGLSSRGLTGLNRIVVSHGHVDHYGNAQTLAEETGCEVHVHPHDLTKVTSEARWYRQLEKSWGFFVKLGLPDATLKGMLAAADKSRPYSRPVDRHRIQLLEPGQQLQFKYFDARVLHLPGHTPGLVCLHVESRRMLFADDHVLAKVSPNPLLDLSQGEGETKFKALVSYYASARAVMALELDCLLPGHGEAFKGHRELLDGLFQFYGLRQQRILKRLESGPASIYELVPAVFPRIDLGRMYLMLSEVLGNVEVLEGEGRVTRVDGDVVRYRV